MTIKIDKNIVGYSIKKPDEAEPAPKATHELMHEEIKRPEELKGYTYKIKTPCLIMHCTSRSTIFC